jgi:hypothetical protein
MKAIDVGTMFLCSYNGTEFKSLRNTFLDIPNTKFIENMFKMSGISYINYNNKLYVLGQDAFEYAQTKGEQLRRPMSSGTISPNEVDALPILKIFFKTLLGEATAGDKVVYSIPANPIDNSDIDIVYHKNICSDILASIGYEGIALNEAMAIIYSECQPEKMTGISISAGCGMQNVGCSHLGMEVFSFSVARSGDYIDNIVANSVGVPKSRVCYIKENDFKITLDPNENIIKQALNITYKDTIKYVVDNMVKAFKSIKNPPNFLQPVPIIISGGTSKPEGYLEFMAEEIKNSDLKNYINIGEIRKAKDPLTAVANGCYVATNLL